MRFGLNDKEFDILTNTLIMPLKSRGAEVWIFGSRARGDHHRYSDIDILYKLKDGSKLPSGFIYDLKTQIEEARIPYKVDLVNDADFAESYRTSLEKDKKIL